MESEIDELVANFCGVTTANPEQAQFFLESTEWQLEPALQLFFDSDGSAHNSVHRATAMNLEDYDLTEDENTAMATARMDSEAWEPNPPAAMATPPPPPSNKDPGRASAHFVTTLGDLGKHHLDSDSDSEEYYTGGEMSGMVVQDLAKKRHSLRGDHVEPAVLRSVQDSGAEVAQRLFSGSSNTLISRQPSTTEQARPHELQASSTPPAPAAVVHTVHIWRNGFTLNEGPLRRLDDVSNLPFLESINRSECPRELESTDRNVPVSVNLVKRITEDWPAPPEPKYVPFKGLGHTLGTRPVSSEELIAPSSVDAPRSSQALTIDDSRPATSIQLRLSDGTRMVARFNTTHTVADIRGFIDAARPGGPGPYQLQTVGFPPVKLTNPKQTIEGAGLLNAVVVQKD